MRKLQSTLHFSSDLIKVKLRNNYHNCASNNCINDNNDSLLLETLYDNSDKHFIQTLIQLSPNYFLKHYPISTTDNVSHEFLKSSFPQNWKFSYEKYLCKYTWACYLQSADLNDEPKCFPAIVHQCVYSLHCNKRFRKTISYVTSPVVRHTECTPKKSGCWYLGKNKKNLKFTNIFFCYFTYDI